MMRIRRYDTDLALSPLFVETTVSLLSGLFLLFWGMIFFANPLFQLSLYTRGRNAILPERILERELGDFHVIGVDPRSWMEHDTDPGRIPTFDILARGINALGEYALELPPDQAVVAGMDYVFLQGSEEELENLVEAVSRIPDNLLLVFGMTLENAPDGYEAFGPAFITEHITIPAIGLRNTRLPNLAPEQRARFSTPLEDRILFGHLHLSEGTIKSGFTKELERVVVGTVPLVTSGWQTAYPSLAFAMYLAGEISGDGISIRSDPFGGQLATGGDDRYFTELEMSLQAESGRGMDRYASFNYLNFLAGGNVTDFPGDYAWLSRLSPPDAASRQVALQRFLDSPDTRGAPLYIFIAPASMADYFGGTGADDEVFTLAAGNDPKTFEKLPVDGVTAHVQSLSNILHSRYIRTADWLAVLLAIVLTLGAAAAVWNTGILRGAAVSVGAALLAVLLSFLMFISFDLFVGIKAALVAIILQFTLITLVRYIVTSRERT